MESVKVFVRNFESLMASQGEDKPSSFCARINRIVGRQIFGPSYWSKIKSSITRGSPQNISLKIIDGTAEALNIEPWQLINPMGFDSNGQSRASSGSPDAKVMEESITFALKAAARENREKDVDFISKVAVASYVAHVSNQKEELIFQVLDIARQTEVKHENRKNKGTA